MGQQWEYKTAKIPASEYLDMNRYGADGWELVAITPSLIHQGLVFSWLAVFKRVKVAGVAQ